MTTETVHERLDSAAVPVAAISRLASPTAGDLHDLAGHRGPCLSLLLPTPWRGVEARQVAIALKGLLRDAEEQAVARGLPAGTVTALLDPVRALVDAADFWRSTGEGAALYVAPGDLRSFRLGTPPASRAAVGERFYLRPLLAPIDDLSFLVLGVSRNRVRLLEGDRESLRELDLGAVPRNFEAALGELQFHRGLQHHSPTPAGQGRRAIVVHGHGADDEEHLEDDLFKYFRLLAEALRERLGDSDRPLVVAAVEEHLPVLLQRAGLPGRVLDEGIAGNPDYLSEHELHERAWPVVEAWAHRAAAAEVAKVRDFLDRSRIATEASKIVRAAAAGRIDTLLTAAGAELWGSFESATQALTIHAQPEPGDEELVNLAACETLAGCGTARELPPGELPEPAPMVALLRW